jgi:chromosome partitioning protein
MTHRPTTADLDNGPTPRTARAAGRRATGPSSTPPAVFAIASSKGGCGKTTSVVSLAGAAVERGLKVLVIDLDAERHLSYWLAPDTPDGSALWEVFDGTRHTLTDAIIPTEHGIDLVPGCERLTRVDLLLAQDPAGVPRALHRALQATDLAAYGLLLLDGPPNLGVLPIAAVTAAGAVLVPLQPGGLDQRGLVKTRSIVDAVRNNLRPDAHIRAAIPTRVKTGTVLGQQTFQRLQQVLGTELVTPPVRDAVAMAAAPTTHRPITVAAPHTAVADDYRAVLDHLLPAER